MDWAWLGELFKGVLTILKGIVHLKWSEIWQGLQDVVQALKDWHRWYVNNVQKPIQQARQNFRKLYDHYLRPVLSLVDTLRRISGVVGLFNKRLAAKLNSIFFRIEAALLAPLRIWQNRINSLGGILRSLLTPLGYLDRATLLNSLWRDVGQLREILRNPTRAVIPAGAPAARIPIAEQVADLHSYFQSDSGPLATRVDAAVDSFRQFLAQS
jgi:hypothetical protein